MSDVRILDQDFIQKFKAVKPVVLSGADNLLSGEIVDRDEDPLKFRAIVRGQTWSEPGTEYENPRAPVIVEERRTSSTAIAEAWVSPDGDDENPGTRSAPFASIQYAIDTLVDRVGHLASKCVHVDAGYYYQSIINYTKNLTIKGKFSNEFEDQRVYATRNTTVDPALCAYILGDDDLSFAYVDTNMTKQSFLEWLDEGGFDHTLSGNEYEYTGAPVTNREVAYEPTTLGAIYATNSKLVNLSFFRAAKDLLFIAGHNENEELQMSGARFIQTEFFGDFKVKNVQDLQFLNSSIFPGDMILDGARRIIGKYPYGPSLGRLIAAPRGGGDYKNVTVNCSGGKEFELIMDSDGPFAPGFSFYGGGDVNIIGGNIRSDLSLEVFQGTGIDITGTRVLGDVDLTNADPANFAWRGGSFYGNLTDPQNIMAGAAAGDYLNVTPS